MKADVRHMRSIPEAVRVLALACALSIVPAPAPTAADGIEPYEQNPWYWQYRGEPVLLLGGTDDDNVFNWPHERMIEHLDKLAAVGGNYDRCTMSSRDPDNERPFKKLASGKYDLAQFNSRFWQRFENYLRAGCERDIVVQVEIWATYDISGADYPFNPEANVNYEASPETTLRVFAGRDGRGLVRTYHSKDGTDFYKTIPELNNDEVVLSYQRAYVDKLLSVSLKHDNVLYTIDNEFSAFQPHEWSRYWARHVRDKARQAGKRVYITEMNIFDWKLGGALRSGRRLTEEQTQRLGGGQSYMFNRNHRATFDHPDVFDFVDLSDNADQKTMEHARNLADVRSYLKALPRPINHVKIYGADFGVKATSKEGINMFWRNIIGGAASCRFHRPATGLGLSPLAQASIRAMRKLELHVEPWRCAPRPDLLKHNEDNEAYLMAEPGKTYGLFFTDFGGDGWVKINFQKYREMFRLRWINIETGEWHGDWIRFASGGSEGTVIQMPFTGSNYGWAGVISSLGEPGDPHR